MNDVSPHKALADSTRVRLVELLGDGPHTVNELADLLNVQPDRLYYHLRILEAAKLVKVRELRPERVYESTAGETLSVRGSSVRERAVLLGAVLEATRSEIQEVLLRDLPADDPGPIDDEHLVALYRGEVVLSADQLHELARRFDALVDEFRQRSEGGAHPGTMHRVLFTAYEAKRG
jgi:DNA-binding transcriptional ArsR family regulator